jgi:hypothetical protein
VNGLLEETSAPSVVSTAERADGEIASAAFQKKSSVERGTTRCILEPGDAGIQSTGKLANLLVETLKRECRISEDAYWEALAMRSGKARTSAKIGSMRFQSGVIL